MNFKSFKSTFWVSALPKLSIDAKKIVKLTNLIKKLTLPLHNKCVTMWLKCHIVMIGGV